MKKILSLLVLIITLFIVASAAVADSSGTGGGSGNINQITTTLTWLIPTILGCMEVILRRVPGASNWPPSVIIMRILNAILPNKTGQPNTTLELQPQRKMPKSNATH